MKLFGNALNALLDVEEPELAAVFNPANIPLDPPVGIIQPAGQIDEPAFLIDADEYNRLVFAIVAG